MARAAQLARLGFIDVDAARERLSRAGVTGGPMLDCLSRAADPDLALAALAAVVETGEDGLRAALEADPATREALVPVLGASAELGRHLARHPDQWRAFTEPLTDVDNRAEMLRVVGARPADEHPVAAADAVDRLRVGYRRRLMQVAAADLAEGAPVDRVSAELADLAAGTLEAALAIARHRFPDAASRCRLAVIGLGKCGGRELNYVSDVDVVFVAEPTEGVDEQTAVQSASRLASALILACTERTAEGSIWPVDVALRPEGKAGPLVRTLASHRAYYERWAKTWEFQAMLKARPVAGDLALGAAYVDAVSPLVWQAASRDGFVEDVQAMRRRVVEQIPAARADRQLKLGPGGLRDIEFAVQLLQLVHGRSDESLRSGTTLVALDATTRGGYVGRDDGARLAAAYRFLRSLEHRIQLYQLRRTHEVPVGESHLRRLGRSLGFTADPAHEVVEEWQRHAREARRLHEKLFYRPLLTAVARLPGPEAQLSPAAANERLTALGYDDPRGALRHLAALTSGVSRRAAIQRTLLPVMLGWFADGPDPDAGLLAFRRVSDALGSTHWYLRLLRDEGAVAQRMARVLSVSRYAADLLLRAPEAVTLLADDEALRPRTREQVEAECRAAAARHEAGEEAITAVRGTRRRELFRVAVADLLGLLDVEEVGRALTGVAAATVTTATGVAAAAVEAERGGALPTRFAVIGMGRLGGCEMGYGSDADVLFVHEPLAGSDEQDAAEAAHAVANEIRRLLSLPGPDPPLPVDANLRPEGRQGPLVRTLASYQAYYHRWSRTWEAQALLRAEPICGDPELRTRFAELVDPLRWPAGGMSAADVREVRRVKARVDAERLPRSADRATHTKLGPGGLSDVEWTVQLLQMRHAGQHAGLRTTQTLAALRAAEELGLVGGDDVTALSRAWRSASRLRNAVTLVRGRPADGFPSDSRVRAGVAVVCGYRPDEAGRMVDDYLRTARRARAVVDRLFWD